MLFRGAPRRWTLTPDERQRLERRQATPVRLSEIAMTTVASPRVLIDVLRAARRGALRSARAEAAWVVATQRVRAEIPDAATGVAWHGEDAFVDALRPHLGDSVRAVEIGCGGGRIANLVAPLTGSLCCSDISATLLDEARVNLSPHPNVSFTRTTGLDLNGLPSDTFDVAFAHDVLINLEADASIALLDAMHRVLGRDGICVFSLYTVNRPEWARDQLAAIRRAAPAGDLGVSHPRAYFADQVEEMLDLVDFDLVDGSYDTSVNDGARAHYTVVARARERRPPER